MSSLKKCGPHIIYFMNIKFSENKDILPFAVTQMNLEDIMLGEISQTNTIWTTYTNTSKEPK